MRVTQHEKTIVFQGLPVTVGFRRFHAMSRGVSSGWHLEVRDSLSRSLILDLKMDDLQFAAFMAGSEHELIATVVQSRVLGYKMETKWVKVPLEQYPSYGRNDKQFLAGVIRYAEQENPGWLADRETQFNSHRLESTVKPQRGRKKVSAPEYPYTYEVILRRWVPMYVLEEANGPDPLDQETGEQGEAGQDAETGRQG